MSVLSQVQLCTYGSLPIEAVGGGPASVNCAKAPMWSVMAPPQKKLRGDTTTLLLVAYGSVGGGAGACVLVNPTIAIIEIGGTHSFLLALSESSELGNNVVRYGPPPYV